MSECACGVLEYKKAIPDEIIVKGDIIMLDTASGLITRAVLNAFPEPIINDSLVVGVCVGSTNDGSMRIIIDGGISKDTTRKLLDGGNSKSIQTIIITGGDAKNVVPKEIIQIAYTGQHMVNISGKTRIGDKITISKDPGIGIAKIALRDPDLYIRTLGKIIDYEDEEHTKATVLLNIE